MSRFAQCLVALALLAAVAVSADWPQWRGTDGLGVAPEGQPLPVSWSTDGRNIKWRAEILGEGNSSPAVIDGRVFVTTAYEGRRGDPLSTVVLVAVVGLGLLFLILLVRKLARGALPIKPRRMGALLLVGGSVVFVVLGVVSAVMPELLFPIGKPGRIWRVGGALAILGLAAAFGWFRAGSRWRLAGAAILVLGAALIVYFSPSGYKGTRPVSERIAYVLPGIAAACWFAFDYFRSRRRSGAVGAPEARSHPWLAAGLVVLSLLVFIPPNFLNRLQRAVVCFDLESGELLWERAVFSAPPEQKWPRGTYATPTPASDGKQVFAYFGAGLASLDHEGKLLWVQKFPEYSRYTRYGAATSPVLTEDSVIVVQEREMYQGGPPSWVAAFDKRSGEPRWRISPVDAHDSYSTPLLLRSEAGTNLLTATWHLLAAYDVETGERLWSVDHPMEELVASVARADDLIALTGGVHGERSLRVMRLEAHTAETLWETKKGVATISSPVLYDGMLFTITEEGFMLCYEAESGTVLWRQRLDGQYFSSLLAGDGKVYASNLDGATTVVAADSDFRSISVNQLEGAIWASPAVSDSCLLIRTDRYLYCIQEARA